MGILRYHQTAILNWVSGNQLLLGWVHASAQEDQFSFLALLLNHKYIRSDILERLSETKSSPLPIHFHFSSPLTSLHPTNCLVVYCQHAYLFGGIGAVTSNKLFIGRAPSILALRCHQFPQPQRNSHILLRKQTCSRASTVPQPSTKSALGEG